ncbi:MAG: recombinase family protein [Planctomycetota bacterium]|nr:recombinase family protein [Planctomycetota bacterium]
MNVVIWARVSSREQREGYSIDAQLRAMRDRAQREDWKVLREFAVAESAKRGAERIAFNEMMDWVRRNAKKEKIGGILSHKLDRVCRNIRDAVRLQELDDTIGVKLLFVDNEFGPGAAGALSFNVMAAVAQYYSDNLRSEVLKGKNEKILQGWLPCGAPYGYMNCDDHDEPIKPDPEQSKVVIRIFELYAKGTWTFNMIADRIFQEGLVYRPSMPKLSRTAISYIVNNRFYLGEINWHRQTFPGKHRPLITHRLFQACQEALAGKNRRTRDTITSPLAGGLFRCSHCGHGITAELIRRRLRRGGVREHLYYRCANNNPGADHPKVRWRAEDIEGAVYKDLAAMKLNPEEAAWFRQTLAQAFSDVAQTQERRRQALLKRRGELTGAKDRLLSAFLNGAVEEVTFQTKNLELKAQLGEVEEALHRCNDVDIAGGDKSLALFDWSQQAAEVWEGSNADQKREILVGISLNRMLSDATICVQKRKPFDLLIERPSVTANRGDWI